MADMRCKLEVTGGTMWRAKVNLKPLHHWAARYDIGLLNKMTPKGIVFSFLFFSFLFYTMRQLHTLVNVLSDAKLSEQKMFYSHAIH